MTSTLATSSGEISPKLGKAVAPGERLTMRCGEAASDTRAAVTAERALLAELEAGCSAPIAALAEVAEGPCALKPCALKPCAEKP